MKTKTHQQTTKVEHPKTKCGALTIFTGFQVAKWRCNYKKAVFLLSWIITKSGYIHWKKGVGCANCDSSAQSMNKDNNDDY